MSEKSEKKEEKPKTEETKPELKPVTEFKISKGLNEYGFLFIPKKARVSLPFEQGVPLKAKVEGETLIIGEK